MPVSSPGWSQHRPRWLTFLVAIRAYPSSCRPVRSNYLRQHLFWGKIHSSFFSHPSCCIGISFFFPLSFFPLCSFSFVRSSPELPYHDGRGEGKREEKTVTNQSRYTCILTKRSEIDAMLLFALWKNEEERSDVGKEKKRVRGVEQGWG